jgi:hypothetical protein
MGPFHRTGHGGLTRSLTPRLAVPMERGDTDPVQRMASMAVSSLSADSVVAP